MAYLSDATYQAIRDDPSLVVQYYNSARSVFINDLGMPGLSEDALKAAWCTVIAYGLKPYGAGPPSSDLDDLLNWPVLDCSGYVSLTWNLMEEFGLASDSLTAVGWDNGAVGNHAQLLFDDATSKLLLDPTICLVVNGVTFDGLVSGVEYEEQWSFFHRADIPSFDATVRQAVADGDYHIRDLIYYRPTFDTWELPSVLGHTFDQENDIQTIIGSMTDDVIDAGAGNDEIYGGKGDDTIMGGIGADYMEGGSGNDQFHVDDADDIVMEFAGQGTDTVYTSVSYVLPDNVEYLLLEGTGASATGNNAANLIYGTDGANVLAGLGGNDILYGLGGNDLLTGGGDNDTIWGGLGGDKLYGLDGADFFYFADISEIAYPGGGTMDILMDFSQAQGDKIWLVGIDANETVDGDQAFEFIGTAAFTAPGQIRWFGTGTETRLIFNTDSDSAFEGIIRFSSNVVPQADWFVL